MNINLKDKLSKLIDKKLQIIIDRLHENGAHAYVVGGTVRDLLLNRETVDLDIEVHDISVEKLKEILAEFGTVDIVGKSFGVLKIFGLDIDWSLPRTDLSGRKPEVTIDPKMGITQALKRRDITINSMAIDLKTYELIDPFGGYQDLKNKILRATDEKFFTEDPLRFYRVMQFIGRFEMFPDAKLNEICKKMDIKNVSKERIEAEFEKLILKSKIPSLGLRWLQEINRLKEILPELYNCINIPQNPDWHPEGDVFEHSMQSLDAAAKLQYNDNEQKLVICFAALCHDLGKAVTTINDEGIWKSPKHDVAGVPLAGAMLKRICGKKDIIEKVKILTRYHVEPTSFITNNAKLSAYKRLAVKLGDVTIEMLYKLLLADKRGRNGKSHVPLENSTKEPDEFLQKAKEAEVVMHKEQPILLGRDLLDVVKAGPELGKLVKKAYDIQINKGIKDKTELRKRVLQNYLKK
ncbi:HD domain-containing protein [Candidatus Dependentiae bacterium]|nr:HD domain-containing protein [Candidatus Dependentiae bacterium]